ncbi:MAG: tol-pal system-associated acyl-CoA thioesterase [Gammaproteobacteria bacterium]|nr:tol-pal system-associated acyl-CoA thioesterase [Gammaproteobacteria bacterium]MCI0590785.1 tol-pal system-associated acyl-CoA thioesterase [Gammaproteobacteria bacterium]
MTEFNWTVRVYYEDTDAGGVVYYANYLKFMERARTEWLRDLGFEQDQLLKNEGLVFAVRRVSLEYLKPARLNDLLTVGVRMIEGGAASIDFEQAVTNETGDVLCQGRVKIVCADAESLRPRPLPSAILSELKHVG